MSIKNMNVKKLNPAVYNPRERLEPGTKEYESLKKSIEKFGFVQPIVWNEATGNIVGGHQRYWIAVDLGMKSVPTKIVNLDDAEEKQLNLALNKIGGEWDEELLASLLNELKDVEGLDLDVTGFDELEIEELTLAFNDPMEEMDDMGDMEEVEEDTKETYKITFDDAKQLEVFELFLEALGRRYDKDAFPTEGSRVYAYLLKEFFEGVNE